MGDQRFRDWLQIAVQQSRGAHNPCVLALCFGLTGPWAGPPPAAGAAKRHRPDRVQERQEDTGLAPRRRRRRGQRPGLLGSKQVAQRGRARQQHKGQCCSSPVEGVGQDFGASLLNDMLRPLWPCAPIGTSEGPEDLEGARHPAGGAEGVGAGRARGHLARGGSIVAASRPTTAPSA